MADAKPSDLLTGCAMVVGFGTLTGVACASPFWWFGWNLIGCFVWLICSFFACIGWFVVFAYLGSNDDNDDDKDDNEDEHEEGPPEQNGSVIKFFEKIGPSLNEVDNLVK